MSSLGIIGNVLQLALGLAVISQTVQAVGLNIGGVASKSDIQQVQNSVNDLTNNVNSLNSTVSNLNITVNSLQNNVNNLTNTINNLANIEPNYIIFQDSAGRVYAMNGKTGQIEYSDTLPEKVFDYILNGTPNLNANGGKIKVTKGVYTFTQFGIYINTHNLVIIEGDGQAVLQHNIMVTNAQGQVGDLYTGNNLFWLEISYYPDAKVVIRNLIIKDIRTGTLPAFNPQFAQKYENAIEAENRIIAVNWGVDYNQNPTPDRLILIEGNTFYVNGSTVVWTSPYNQFLWFVRNKVIGAIGDNVHFDYAGQCYVFENKFINTQATQQYDYPAVFYWGTDGNIQEGAKNTQNNVQGIVAHNTFINCGVGVNNPSNIIIANNTFEGTIPPYYASATYFIHLYRSVNVQYNQNKAFILNNILVDNTGGNNWAGIRIDGYHIGWVIIANNHIQTGGNTIIIYLSTDYPPVENIWILNNILYGQWSVWINILNSAQSAYQQINNIKIIGNLLYGSALNPVDIRGLINNLTIKDNRILVIGGYTNPCISLSGTLTNGIIADNELVTPGATKIGISGLTSYTNLKTRNNINFNPQPIRTLTVGASPFVYQNKDIYEEDIVISGGSVSNVEYSRDGTNYISLGVVPIVHLDVGEYVRVTYTTAPTMLVIPR